MSRGDRALNSLCGASTTEHTSQRFDPHNGLAETDYERKNIGDGERDYKREEKYKRQGEGL